MYILKIKCKQLFDGWIKNGEEGGMECGDLVGILGLLSLTLYSALDGVSLCPSKVHILRGFSSEYDDAGEQTFQKAGLTSR